MSPSGEFQSPRSRIVSLIAVACLTMIAVRGMILDFAEIHSLRPGPDPVLAGERRFNALKRSLPDHGLVGYISDRDPSNIEANRERVLAQYSLVPLVFTPAPPADVSLIDPALRQEATLARQHSVAPSQPASLWIVGDFRDPKDAPDIAWREHLSIVRDFGAGTMLLRRISE